MTFNTNRLNYFLRIISLFIFVALIYLFIERILEEKAKAVNFTVTLIFMSIMIMLTIYLFITIITSLFISVIKINVDIENNIITFISLFSSTLIHKSDLIEYVETIHSGRSFKKYYGLIIKLKNDNFIQLADQNINNLNDFKEYLNQQGICCTGTSKMKFPFN